MIVKNETRKTLLAKNLKVASSPKDKFLGLLIKTNPRALLFETRFGIHTFFMKSPIDIILLSDKNVVVKKETLKPNKIFMYNPSYKKILELPEFSIVNSKTKIGDKITFSDII